MIKVDRVPTDTELPEARGIWAITRRELGQVRKSIEEFCQEKFGYNPVFVYYDQSLRVYYIGVN